MITQVVADHIHSAPGRNVKPIIRPATERDVQAIADVVTANARQGQLLPRSAENIRASLPQLAGGRSRWRGWSGSARCST